MRKSFPGHYAPSEDEFFQMLKTGTVVFDTNVLLDLYKFTPKTRDHFLQILEKLRPQIWIPHQVGKEYQRNRFEKVDQQFLSYDELISKFQTFSHTLDNFKQHPFVDHETLSKRVKDFCDEQINLIKTKAKVVLGGEDSKIAFRQQSELLHQQITKLFDGKVGPAYKDETLKEKKSAALERYKLKIPPGYKDLSGNENVNPGDGILWFQLLDKAKAEPKPYIFVTGDSKEDWWFKDGKRVIAPRKELVEEIIFLTGSSYWQLQTDDFIRLAGPAVGIKEEVSVLNEVQAVREESERLISSAKAPFLNRHNLLFYTNFRKMSTIQNELLSLLTGLSGSNTTIENQHRAIYACYRDGLINPEFAKNATTLSRMLEKARLDKHLTENDLALMVELLESLKKSVVGLNPVMKPEPDSLLDE